jgi:hypothetical protein
MSPHRTCTISDFDRVVLYNFPLLQLCGEESRLLGTVPKCMCGTVTTGVLNSVKKTVRTCKDLCASSAKTLVWTSAKKKVRNLQRFV